MSKRGSRELAIFGIRSVGRQYTFDHRKSVANTRTLSETSTHELRSTANSLQFATDSLPAYLESCCCCCCTTNQRFYFSRPRSNPRNLENEKYVREKNTINKKTLHHLSWEEFKPTADIAAVKRIYFFCLTQCTHKKLTGEKRHLPILPTVPTSLLTLLLGAAVFACKQLSCAYNNIIILRVASIKFIISSER